MNLTPPVPVRHVRSQQSGHALEFNENDDNPAYWVEWEDKSGNWFAPEDLDFANGDTKRAALKKVGMG